MASSRKTTRAAPVDGGYSPCQPGPSLRLIGVVTAFAMAMPPLPLVAATRDARETVTNPFVWPPPTVPLPAQVPGMFTERETFPSFAIAPVGSPLLPQAPADLPWLPGDLDPIAPPDGMPVQGNPAGLALLENAVGNGIVIGEVSDATSLDPIPGALVELKGTGRTAEADAQGRFQFAGLPAGTFNIEASQLGYFTDTTVVTVVEGSPSEIRFGLRARPTDDTVDETTLEEESVIGEYQGDSGGDLFMDLELTSSIASGISKDDFTKSGVSDAGDAVSKISGANIVGGKYAVIRGLGDRYSNTLVNGALISSADPTKKAVQLDLFPSDLLESISIYKTFIPELPAEFAGGTVAIQTLQFPKERILKVEYGQKTSSVLEDGVFLGSGQDLGLFGRVDNDLPSVIPPLEQGILTAGVTSPAKPSPTNPTALRAIEQANALHLSSNLRPVERDSQIPESFALTFGDTFELSEGLELGVVVAGTSSNGDEAARGIEVGRSLNSGGDGIPGSDDDSLNRTQIEDRYTASAGYGLLGSFGLRLDDRHSLSFTAFRNYQAEDEVTRANRIRDDTSGSGEFQDYAGPGSVPTGDLQSTPFGATAATYRGLDNTTPLRRQIDLLQLSGHHEFGDEEKPIEIDWMHSRNESVEQRPATRTLFYTELDFADPTIAENVTGAVLNPSLGRIFTLSDVYGINPALSQSFRETLSTEEESENSRIDITLPVATGEDSSLKFKLGGNQFDRSREIRGRFFTYNIGQPLNDRLASENGGDYGIEFLEGINGILDPNGVPIFNGHANNNQSSAIFIQENTRSGNTVRNVDAGTEVIGTYLQADAKFGRWSVVGGARYETEDRSFEVLSGLNPAGTVVPFTLVQNDYLLPGIMVNRTFGDKEEYKATLAWSRTVARPTFFEFAPIRTVDQASGDTFQGNSALTDTLIDNYDIRWEWMPDATSQLALSLFHKSLKDPIAQSYGLGERTFVNGTAGTLQGMEIEARKSFGEHWSMSSNYTFIDSLLQFIQPPNQEINTTFDGQPNHILNAALGWQDPDSGWSATLNYNMTGSFLTSVPSSAVEPPVRREAFTQLDLVIQKRFEFEKGAGIVTINLGNLLDSADTEVFDGTDFVYREFKPGRTFGLKFDYQF